MKAHISNKGGIMLRKILFTLMFLLFPVIVFALPGDKASAIQWDKNPANATLNITNYKIYWKDSGMIDWADTHPETGLPTSYKTVDAVSTTASFADMGIVDSLGLTFIVVAMDNSNQESVPSNETIAPPIPEALSGASIKLIITFP